MQPADALLRRTSPPPTACHLCKVLAGVFKIKALILVNVSHKLHSTVTVPSMLHPSLRAWCASEQQVLCSAQLTNGLCIQYSGIFQVSKCTWCVQGWHCVTKSHVQMKTWPAKCGHVEAYQETDIQDGPQRWFFFQCVQRRHFLNIIYHLKGEETTSEELGKHTETAMHWRKEILS